MDRMCIFPECDVIWDCRESGKGTQKYCKPHSELIRRTKRKGYDKKRAEVNPKIRKVFLRKCVKCNEYLPITCTLRRRFCGECLRDRRTDVFNKANHSRATTRTYTRMYNSIENNLKVYIGKGE